MCCSFKRALWVQSMAWDPMDRYYSILFPCCFHTVAVYAIRYVGLLLKRVILQKPWRRLSGLFLVFTRNEPNTRFFRWHEESPHTIKHMISLKPLATATLLSSIPHEQPCWFSETKKRSPYCSRNRMRIFILAAVVAIVSASPVRSSRKGDGNEACTLLIFALLVTDSKMNNNCLRIKLAWTGKEFKENEIKL